MSSRIFHCWSLEDNSSPLTFDSFRSLTGSESSSCVIFCGSAEVTFRKNSEPLEVNGCCVSSGAQNIAFRTSYRGNNCCKKQSHYRPGQAQRVLRKLRFPDFVTTAQDGGRLSALRTARLYPQEILLVLISVRGWVYPRAIVRSEGYYVNEKSNDTSWDRSSDLPICSTAL